MLVLRRLGGLGAAAIAVLAIAAVALAKDPWHAKYTGAPDAGGSISFRTKTVGHKHKVLGLKFTSLPVACSDGASPSTDSTAGDIGQVLINVTNQKFHLHATASNPGLESTLVFDGKLKQHRSKASGTIHIYGSLVPVSSGNPRPCDSGVLHWTAKRQ